MPRPGARVVVGPAKPGRTADDKARRNASSGEDENNDEDDDAEDDDDDDDEEEEEEDDDDDEDDKDVAADDVDDDKVEEVEAKDEKETEEEAGVKGEEDGDLAHRRSDTALEGGIAPAAHSTALPSRRKWQRRKRGGGGGRSTLLRVAVPGASAAAATAVPERAPRSRPRGRRKGGPLLGLGLRLLALLMLLAGSGGAAAHEAAAAARHPYNEYSWELNQLNPWLSACDLAGPAPADLQGSCGPPEVPKECPGACQLPSASGSNGLFDQVIGTLERTRARALAAMMAAKRKTPASAATTTTITTAGAAAAAGAASQLRLDYNKDKPAADGEEARAKTKTREKPKGQEEGERGKEKRDGPGGGYGGSAMKNNNNNKEAPVQCLYYLEESHKREVCREEFGRTSSRSFPTTRENRYWFMSGLRLRHCCEHTALNALAPGKAGPLEAVLAGGTACVGALDKLLMVNALAARLHCEFGEVLARYDCRQTYSVIHNCTHCKEAYRKWVCSSLVPYFAHGGPLDLEPSEESWTGRRIRPCRSLCQSVEQRCPYLLPGDRAPAYPTQYAGEPTFLCQDPNIPETGEQAAKAVHPNSEDECCFNVCAEEEPALGVCANCTGRSFDAGPKHHDPPTAPQCDITSPFQGTPQDLARQSMSRCPITKFGMMISISSSSSSGGGDSVSSSSGSPDFSEASLPETSSASESTTSTTTISASTSLLVITATSSLSSSPSLASSSSSSSAGVLSSPLPLLCLFWLWGVLFSRQCSMRQLLELLGLVERCLGALHALLLPLLAALLPCRRRLPSTQLGRFHRRGRLLFEPAASVGRATGALGGARPRWRPDEAGGSTDRGCYRCYCCCRRCCRYRWWLWPGRWKLRCAGRRRGVRGCRCNCWRWLWPSRWKSLATTTATRRRRRRRALVLRRRRRQRQQRQQLLLHPRKRRRRKVRFGASCCRELDLVRSTSCCREPP